jgi:hypothetical protein
MPDVILEFFSTFFIKRADIYFGHKDKVYAISKQLVVDIFGVYAKGYVEILKGLVNKSLTIQALQSGRLGFVNSSIDQWTTKSLGLPYLVRYLAIIFFIYQRETVQYFSNKNVITLMRA